MHCFQNLAIDILVESKRANNSVATGSGKKTWKQQEDYTPSAWWAGVILYGAKKPESPSANIWNREDLLKIEKVEQQLL